MSVWRPNPRCNKARTWRTLLASIGGPGSIELDGASALFTGYGADHICPLPRSSRASKPSIWMATPPQKKTKAEAVALPVEDFHSVTVAIQKNKKDRIEYGDLDIPLDQGGQIIDGFSEVHRLGVEVHLFDFGVGSHHGGRGSREIREHSIGDQRMALNVGFMARLRKYCHHR